MKIGINVKIIKDTLDMFETVINYLNGKIVENEINIANHETRITSLENSGSEWVEITSINGQEAEITQEFSEIKMQARGTGTLYSVTCNYDSNIFHNSSSNAPTYMICGNPTENNFGCKFKYMVTSNGKQFVCVDKCFSGGSQEGIEFRAWIKPVVQTGNQ